jgi:hypothetical protein
MDTLPRDLALTPANIHAHIVSKTSTQFTMMHTVLLLGRMMLHREYIPFIPLRSSKPEGPLDPPLFPPDKYQVPHGFWAYTASELFRSARALVDLAHTCHEWKVLPQTPIVGFAIYIAAFAGEFLTLVSTKFQLTGSCRCLRHKLPLDGPRRVYVQEKQRRRTN